MVTCFNSIKVRLELLNWLHLQILIQFQFHKGTIRTGVLPNVTNEGVTLFQFHKGTIRTKSEVRRRDVGEVSIP